MDRSPAEIWSHIFSYACQDGGATGCSLSLTSKYIHETSKSVRHRSVALCGVTKISCFYHLLKREKTGPITYLFISDEDLSGNTTYSTRNVLCTPSRVDPPVTVQIGSILRSNAASLSSLSIASFHFTPQLLPPIHFPFIVDLSFVSPGKRDRISPPQPHPETLPVFPYLKRLRLVDVDVFDQLSSVSPSLTHLHITGHRSVPLLDELPATVQSIILQPASCVAGIDTGPYLGWLQHVARLKEETTVWSRTTLLKAPTFRPPCPSHQARIAWERTKEKDITRSMSKDKASVEELAAQLRHVVAPERFLP